MASRGGEGGRVAVVQGTRRYEVGGKVERGGNGCLQKVLFEMLSLPVYCSDLTLQ